MSDEQARAQEITTPLVTCLYRRCAHENVGECLADEEARIAAALAPRPAGEAPSLADIAKVIAGWDPAHGWNPPNDSAYSAASRVVALLAARPAATVPVAPPLIELAERAAANRADSPPDIADWAQRLAEDVADLPEETAPPPAETTASGAVSAEAMRAACAKLVEDHGHSNGATP